jgi:hypothetical protein
VFEGVSFTFELALSLLAFCDGVYGVMFLLTLRLWFRLRGKYGVTCTGDSTATSHLTANWNLTALGILL